MAKKHMKKCSTSLAIKKCISKLPWNIVEQIIIKFNTKNDEDFYFLWYWGLNSGPQSCWAGALPLEPFCQPTNTLFNRISLASLD
jgi:hypothetical protein